MGGSLIAATGCVMGVRILAAAPKTVGLRLPLKPRKGATTAWTMTAMAVQTAVIPIAQTNPTATSAFRSTHLVQTTTSAVRTSAEQGSADKDSFRQGPCSAYSQFIGGGIYVWRAVRLLKLSQKAV